MISIIQIVPSKIKTKLLVTKFRYNFVSPSNSIQLKLLSFFQLIKFQTKICYYKSYYFNVVKQNKDSFNKQSIIKIQVVSLYEILLSF